MTEFEGKSLNAKFIIIVFFIQVLIVGCISDLARASARQELQSPPLYVLVPGFFNTAIPGSYTKSDGYTPYFSKAVVNAVKRFGQVIVVRGLIPVGTVPTNGAILERSLGAIAEKYPGRRMIIISHSAGGLYSAWALTRRPDFPVDTVVTIATPYMGIDFIDYLSASVPGLATLAHHLCLDSLREFRTVDMAALLKSFSVPQHIRWISIAGRQEACGLTSCTQAKYLSWLLTIPQKLTGKPSDGIVTVDSALGYGANLRGATGLPIQIERWADMEIPLEHWEIVQEANLFRFLGVLDIHRIRDLQTQVFTSIIERLKRAPFSAQNQDLR